MNSDELNFLRQMDIFLDAKTIRFTTLAINYMIFLKIYIKKS
jgi:hypothetical protein